MKTPASTPPVRSLRSVAAPAATNPSWVLCVLVAVCLVIDTVVHLQLASGYEQAARQGTRAKDCGSG